MLDSEFVTVSCLVFMTFQMRDRFLATTTRATLATAHFSRLIGNALGRLVFLAAEGIGHDRGQLSAGDSTQRVDRARLGIDKAEVERAGVSLQLGRKVVEIGVARQRGVRLRQHAPIIAAEMRSDT